MHTLTILAVRRARGGQLPSLLAALRAHLAELEPDLRPTWILLDQVGLSAGPGLPPPDDVEPGLLVVSSAELSDQQAREHLRSLVRTPYFLLLEEGWELVNPERVRWVAEALAILESDARIEQVRLDTRDLLAFADRRLYDGPFRAHAAGVDFFVMDPRRVQAGGTEAPAISRASSAPAPPAPSVTVKSPALLLFRPIDVGADPQDRAHEAAPAVRGDHA